MKVIIFSIFSFIIWVAILSGKEQEILEQVKIYKQQEILEQVKTYLMAEFGENAISETWVQSASSIAFGLMDHRQKVESLHFLSGDGMEFYLGDLGAWKVRWSPRLPPSDLGGRSSKLQFDLGPECYQAYSVWWDADEVTSKVLMLSTMHKMNDDKGRILYSFVVRFSMEDFHKIAPKTDELSETMGLTHSYGDIRSDVPRGDVIKFEYNPN